MLCRDRTNQPLRVVHNSAAVNSSLRELAAKKRGAKPAERNPLDAKVRALEAQVARLEHELHTAHTILDVQGKVAGLLGLNLEHGTRS